MRLFWQIIGKIANCMIRKKEAAGTRIWGSKGHYMGLNFGVFLQIGVYKGTDFWAGQLNGLTGVFFGVSGSNPLRPHSLHRGVKWQLFWITISRDSDITEIRVYSLPSSASGDSSSSSCWFL